MKLTCTQTVTNRYSINDQYRTATSGAKRAFAFQAEEQKRLVDNTQLVSAVNDGEFTVFEFTAEAIRPVHFYYRQWRDNRRRAAVKRNHRAMNLPKRWFYQDGTVATERIGQRHWSRNQVHRA